jgi:hypothetical protein
VMGDLDGAMQAYEQALRHNQWSIRAMNGISAILRTREMFPKAVEYLLSISKLDPTNGETWGSLGLFPSFVAHRNKLLTISTRPLLSHDGRPPAGILIISASIVSSPRPKGLSACCKICTHSLNRADRNPNSGMV